MRMSEKIYPIGIQNFEKIRKVIIFSVARVVLARAS